VKRTWPATMLEFDDVPLKMFELVEGNALAPAVDDVAGLLPLSTG